MKFFPYIVFITILLCLIGSGVASYNEPTHFNILYKDSLGRMRVVSEPFDNIDRIFFKSASDKEAYDSVKIELSGYLVLPDTLINHPDTITNPNDTIINPSDTTTISPDTIPNLPDTIPSVSDTIPASVEEEVESDLSSSSQNRRKYIRSIVNKTKGMREITLSMDSVTEYSFGTNVPTIRIFTDTLVSELFNKSLYLPGYMSFSGFGAYEDLDSVAVNIRGRGNSTWKEEKKPYRLKFSKKLSLCGLASAKNFVLIANYIDPTYMRNAMAFKLAELLDMPFTNHSIPVNVEFNGIKKGAYMLSEKQGIGKGSVNIDEEKGVLWELDTNFDEDYKFMSSKYDLPVMLADPDPLDFLPDSISPLDWFEPWKEDFEVMEASVKAGNPEETIDMNSVVDYLLVNLLSGNCEVDWPKSVKLFKPDRDSLYVFGPVWDFDWGFGYAFPYTRKLLVTYPTDLKGSFFFRDIVKSSQFMPLFAQRWEEFKNNIMPTWLDYLDEYAEMVRISAMQDYELWQPEKRLMENFDDNVNSLREWIENRIKAIDSNSRYMLY